jgi:polyvinyl alcohol dehydrogenase (cytochrome)
MGGIHHGSAADATQVYAAVSDIWRADIPRPGLTALKIATGEELWHVPTPQVACSWLIGLCRRGQSAAVTVIPGVVFSGAVDGHIRAYAADTGTIVWDHDTATSHPVVGGGRASGGSIDDGGTTIAHGTVYVNSGYADTGLGKKGNLLLAFTVDGK